MREPTERDGGPRAIQRGDCLAGQMPKGGKRRAGSKPDLREGRTVPLTRAETTVLDLVLDGQSSKQIAADLCRSIRTIEVHRHHIMSKLGAHNLVELVRLASSRSPYPQGPHTTPQDLENT